MKVGLELSPVMVLVLFLSFLGVSFFMGMLIHSSFMYEDKKDLKRDSRKAWVLPAGCFFIVITQTFFKGVSKKINQPKVPLNDSNRF